MNPSELGAGTRGASMGPGAIQSAAREKESTLFGEHEIRWIPEHNFLLDQENRFPHAKHIDGIVQIFDSLIEEIKNCQNRQEFPIVIAGDHSSGGGTLAGVCAANPGKRVGVIWIDAHGDLHSPYTTPSGNVHGMPLATALAEDNIDYARNQPAPETVQHWNALKNAGGSSPKIEAQDLVFMGVRDTEKEENAIIDSKGIRNYTVAEVREKGIAQCLQEIEQKLSACDLIYISFDVDSMDPELTSHGTGTPVPNGFTPDEAKDIILGLLENPKTSCFELVEVNPCLDEKKNKMAETAFDIIQEIVQKLSDVSWNN